MTCFRLREDLGAMTRELSGMLNCLGSCRFVVYTEWLVLENCGYRMSEVQMRRCGDEVRLWRQRGRNINAGDNGSLERASEAFARDAALPCSPPWNGLKVNTRASQYDQCIFACTILAGIYCRLVYGHDDKSSWNGLSLLG